jgi:hypothetical protein
MTWIVALLCVGLVLSIVIGLVWGSPRKQSRSSFYSGRGSSSGDSHSSTPIIFSGFDSGGDSSSSGDCGGGSDGGGGGGCD